MPDELKLNSITRFSKSSPRLHLEEHGHCEVPAGCGGVVLRWYNPADAVPVLFRGYAPTPHRVFINGIAPASARPLVRLGEVVLAFEFDAVIPEHALFIFGGGHTKAFHFKEESKCIVRTVPDGSWQFSLTPPPEGWMFPGFDASAWPELVERPLDPPPVDHYHARAATTQLDKFRAVPLGLPTKVTASKVWVRKVFMHTA